MAKKIYRVILYGYSGVPEDENGISGSEILTEAYGEYMLFDDETNALINTINGSQVCRIPYVTIDPTKTVAQAWSDLVALIKSDEGIT